MTAHDQCNNFSRRAVSGVLLRPGEWHFATGRVLIRTTLGSCVAIAVWHPERGYGGLCHYMLPRRLGTEVIETLDGRYAEDALALLAQAASHVGTQLKDYQAKIFGGAEMFHLPRRGPRSVSLLNIEAAENLAEHHKLNVVARDLGGSVYRQIIFSTMSGTVWMRCGTRGSPARPLIGSKR